MITNQPDLRAAFWRDHPQYTRRPGWTQNNYPADIRVEWVAFVDHMNRVGAISDALASRATL